MKRRKENSEKQIGIREEKDNFMKDVIIFNI
jgi:hypothetical protein